MSDTKKSSNTSKPSTSKTSGSYSGNGLPTGQISRDVIQHSLKPHAPVSRPTNKPTPGPKSK